MVTDAFEPNVMTLFDDDGERKYLNARERKRFYRSRKILKDLHERTFVELIFWTGCRISEALQLCVVRVNVEDSSVVFKTLKQHGKNKGKRFRIVPVPRCFMRMLDKVHGILRSLRDETADHHRHLWHFKRQRGLDLVKAVMTKAKIFGIRATSRGLRHTFGVTCILNNVPELRLQRYMGHTSLKMTSTYTQLVSMEDRQILQRTWRV